MKVSAGRLHHFIDNKVFLLTGGAGSLGAVLVKRLLEFRPHSVRIFSRDEYKHQRLWQWLKDKRLRFLIGDVRDKDRLFRAMEGVDYVIHLAALKGVQTGEYNPIEVIKTNILGASNVVEVALERKVKKVLGISTDKAVMPETLYGVTKLAAEKIFQQGRAYAGKNPAAIGMIRLPNTMDTKGNVFEIFKRQALTSQVLGVTDSKMIRPFITRSMAVESILEALYRLSYSETFVYRGALNYSIMDVAKLFGNKIEIIGRRAGDRLRDPMMSESEIQLAQRLSDNLYCIGNRPSGQGAIIKEELARMGSREQLRSLFAKIEEYE